MKLRAGVLQSFGGGHQNMFSFDLVPVLLAFTLRKLGGNTDFFLRVIMAKILKTVQRL